MRRGHGRCRPARRNVKNTDKINERSEKELQKLLIKRKVIQDTDQRIPYDHV